MIDNSICLSHTNRDLFLVASLEKKTTSGTIITFITCVNCVNTITKCVFLIQMHAFLKVVNIGCK